MTPCHVCGNTTGPCEHMSAHLYPEDESMSNRKPYNDCVGYIASRRNDVNRGWVVIYNAKEAGIDDAGGKYAVVCEEHGTILNTTSIPKARPLLKYPEFCTDCRRDAGDEETDQ
jgi:hypothetical protein